MSASGVVLHRRGSHPAWQVFAYIQITWRPNGGDGWHRTGWGHEEHWAQDTHWFSNSNGGAVRHSIVPKRLYPDYPDGLPSHRREIDLYPEFRDLRR